jgi:hypothetical protein
MDDNMAHAYCMLDTEDYSHMFGIYYLLIFYCNNGCANASQCYVIRILPVCLNVHSGTINVNLWVLTNTAAFQNKFPFSEQIFKRI